METSLKNKKLAEPLNRFVAKGFSSAHEVYIESGKGAILKDVTGREYIDFSGGIGVMNIGHSLSLIHI